MEPGGVGAPGRQVPTRHLVLATRVDTDPDRLVGPCAGSRARGGLADVGVEERYVALTERFAGRPGVALPGGGSQFGASALKAGGSVFAMLQAGRLVVKLPAERVAELIAGGAGGPFGHEGRRPMRQWLVVQDDARWDELAEEALAFVGG